MNSSATRIRDCIVGSFLHHSAKTDPNRQRHQRQSNFRDHQQATQHDCASQPSAPPRAAGFLGTIFREGEQTDPNNRGTLVKF